MRCSAFANVRAHLRFVSRIGHNHALSMWALPTAVTRWASSRAWRASAGASAPRAADAEPRTSSESTLAHARSSAASTSARRALPTGNSSSNFRSTYMSMYSASTSRCATASSARFRRYDGGPSKSGSSKGHGDVPNGGSGFAAASTSTSIASPPAAGRATTCSRCSGCRPCTGPSSSQIRPSALNPTPTPPRSMRATTSSPRHRSGIAAWKRNQVVSHRPPHMPGFGKGSYSRRRASSTEIGSPRTACASTANGTLAPNCRGLDDRLQHPVDTGQRSVEVVGHAPLCGFDLGPSNSGRRAVTVRALGSAPGPEATSPRRTREATRP